MWRDRACIGVTSHSQLIHHSGMSYHRQLNVKHVSLRKVTAFLYNYMQNYFFIHEKNKNQSLIF